MATSHWPVGSLGPHEFRNAGEIRFTLPLQRNRELRKRLGQREGGGAVAQLVKKLKGFSI